MGLPRGRAAAGRRRRHPAADRASTRWACARARGTRRCFTTLKLAGIAALCVCAFALPHAGAPPDAAAAVPQVARPLWLALVLAMIPVLFAYDGWTDATYVAGEITDAAPQPAHRHRLGARCW